MRRPCLDCGYLVDRPDSRCVRCLGRHQATKVARKRRIYNPAWRLLSEDARASGGRCSWCGSTEDLTLDHVIPGSLEGGTRILCRTCNGTKGATSDKRAIQSVRNGE